MKRKYKEPIMKPVELKGSTILAGSDVPQGKVTFQSESSDQDPATQGWYSRDAWSNQ